MSCELDHADIRYLLDHFAELHDAVLELVAAGGDTADLLDVLNTYVYIHDTERREAIERLAVTSGWIRR